MSYYRTCPRCGAHLDPGEACDCLDEEAQLLIDHVKNAHAGDANTSVGRVEHVESTVSTSSIPEILGDCKEDFQMSEIEKVQRYIANPKSGKFPLSTRYQMCLSELMALAHMDRVDAVCLAFDFGRAKGYRAAKAEVRR